MKNNDTHLQAGTAPATANYNSKKTPLYPGNLFTSKYYSFMKKNLLLLMLAMLSMKVGFSQRKDMSAFKGPRPVINLATMPADAYYQGVVSIKFNYTVANLLKMNPAISNEGFVQFGIPAVDAINRQYGVNAAQLTFAAIIDNSGKFTERHKDWGFDLWYQLKFPATVDVKRIIAAYQGLAGVIDIAEPSYKKQPIGDKFDPLKAPKTKAPKSPLKSTTIFNDPRFNEQWHYNNTGQQGGTADADIDLPEAWDLETGKSNVIIAVNDGGIAITHADIMANLWTGGAGGTSGFNFIANNTTITPDNDYHGTHVSGTIAAVNNNGTGVNGVAGGDGTPGSGVRLMSCEVFGPGGTAAASFGPPFIWSADRGAAVSQNSWGYTQVGAFEQAVLDGIDYFILHGGGTVMAGGIVICAAGNDNTEGAHYPGFYAPTLAVAATNNRDVRSYYSNFGTWVDISAPGGEQSTATDARGVLSTLTPSTYGFYQGTSMACPHVSGVAGLIISKAPGIFTTAQVRAILLAQVDNHYPVNSATYAGKLGTGRLNAFKCLQQVASVVGSIARDAKVSAFVNPVSGSNICVTPFAPVVSVLNLGSDTLKTITVTYKLDALAPVVSSVITLAGAGLPTFGSQNITLTPAVNPAVGAHTIKAWTSNPNGAVDLRPTNDTSTSTFTVIPTLPLNSFVDFEPAAAAFPTPNYVNYNPDAARGWAKRTGVTGPTGAATSCMWIDAANYATTGQVDRYQTQKIDLAGVDSIKISWYTAKTYWPGFLTDTMRIVYSDDCGATWKPTTYKRGGASFNTITAAGQAGDYVPASASEWRLETLDFSTCNLASNSILFGWEFTNGFGNNIFVDDIRINKVNTVNPNAAVLNISSPSNTVCTNTFTPVITIGNYGTGPLTTATVNVSIDGGAPATFNYTGNLARCSTQVVTLPSVTSTPGTHIITIYTTNPNGTADLSPSNDTVRKTFAISPTMATPLFEGFETTTFAPTGWGVQNPLGSITWARSTAAHRSGTAAMWINNPANANASDVDRFFSPVVSNNAAIDSMFVSFDHSYIPGVRFPGSTVFPLDTLEVMVTTDCGATFKTIWKKWGEDLQSIADPNFAYVPSFTPTQDGEWKNTRIYLTPFVGSSNFQVYFVAKGNKQNNIWLDNINISSRTLPAKLKNQGYLIYPNPFTSSFRVHHWVAPVDLQAIQVYNSIGELVSEKHYNGNANTEINVDLSSLAAGMYMLKMTYQSKTVVEKIIKR